MNSRFNNILIIFWVGICFALATTTLQDFLVSNNYTSRYPDSSSLKFAGTVDGELREGLYLYPFEIAKLRQLSLGIKSVQFLRSRWSNVIYKNKVVSKRYSGVTRGFFTLFGAPITPGHGFDSTVITESSLANQVVISRDMWIKEFSRRDLISDIQLQIDGVFYHVVGVIDDSFKLPQPLHADVYVLDSFDNLPRNALAAPSLVIVKLAENLNSASVENAFDSSPKESEEVTFSSFLRGRSLRLFPISKGFDNYSLASAKISHIASLICISLCIFNIVFLFATDLAVGFGNDLIRVVLGIEFWSLFRRTLGRITILVTLGCCVGGLFYYPLYTVLFGGSSSESFFHSLSLLGATGALTLASVLCFSALVILTLITAYSCFAYTKNALRNALARHAIRIFGFLKISLLIVGGMGCTTFVIVTTLLSKIGEMRTADLGISNSEALKAAFTGSGDTQLAGSRLLEMASDLRALPGVRSVSVGSDFVLNQQTDSPFYVENDSGDIRKCLWQFADEEAVKTLGLRLIRGDWFGPSGRSGVVITRSLANFLGGLDDIIGESFSLQPGEYPANIIGVVEDITNDVRSYRGARMPIIFSNTQDFENFVSTIYVDGETAMQSEILKNAERIVGEKYGDCVIRRFDTLSGWRNLLIKDSLASLKIASVFSLLAALIIWGCVFVAGGCFVIFNRKSIALRFAVGAQRWQVMRYVAVRVLTPLALGAAIGIALIAILVGSEGFWGAYRVEGEGSGFGIYMISFVYVIMVGASSLVAPLVFMCRIPVWGQLKSE